MPNRPARFTAADLRRALKLADEAGRDVEITPDGTIRLVLPSETKRPKGSGIEPVREIVL